MPGDLCWTHDVVHLPFVFRERIRNERAVTSPGERLGAHDCGPPLASDAFKLRKSVGEMLGTHIIGESAKGQIAPTPILRFLGRVPKAAQRLKALVLDRMRLK